MIEVCLISIIMSLANVSHLGISARSSQKKGGSTRAPTQACAPALTIHPTGRGIL